MQLREIPITPVPEDSSELDEEAEWIYRQAFCKPTISTQVRTRTIRVVGEKSEKKVVGIILVFVRRIVKAASILVPSPKKEIRPSVK
jgi:hypothetical protein